MKQFILLTTISCVLLITNAAKLPNYLKKCKKGPDSAKCVVENGIAAQLFLKSDGEPKFGLQSLSPINVPKIDLQATPDLKVILNDANFYGVDTFTFKDGTIDDNELIVKGHMDRLEVVGKYDINGRILVLPIQGVGNCNLTILDFDFSYKTKLMIEERKGKKYFKVQADENSVGVLESIGGARWRLDNLFNGDKRLGDEMNRFLNENWKEVTDEVKGAIEKTIAYSIFTYFINGYLHYLPIDEIFES